MNSHRQPLFSELPGQIGGTKKPAGLTPCGLPGLRWMALVTINQEFGGLGEVEEIS